MSSGGGGGGGGGGGAAQNLDKAELAFKVPNVLLSLWSFPFCLFKIVGRSLIPPSPLLSLDLRPYVNSLFS